MPRVCGRARWSPSSRPRGPFWEAEPEHQDYLVKHPNGYTCHYPVRAGSCRDARSADGQRSRTVGSAPVGGRPGVSVFPEEMVMQSRCIQQAPELQVPWWIDGEGRSMAPLKLSIWATGSK